MQEYLPTLHKNLIPTLDPNLIAAEKYLLVKCSKNNTENRKKQSKS